MEAKELMFNDLVKAKGYSGIIRVDADTMYVIENGNRTPYFNKDDIIPIELSEEILLANGFERYEDDFKCPPQPLSEFSLYINISAGHGTAFSVTEYNEPLFFCEYVHELQHALRLCGLTDLADNFQY